jgi:LysR substrate binding domain
VTEGYDLALRCTGAEFPAGLIARRLRSVRFLIAASRGYLDQHGTPRSPAELASHDFVGIGDSTLCR